MTRTALLAIPLLLLAACRAPRAEVPPPETLVTREQWGSRPEPLPEARRHTPRVLTLHHAGVAWKPDDVARDKVRGLQGYGQREKGWPDLPYHYLIAPDGAVFEGRPISHAGETNTEYDPKGHALVMLYGNFEVQRVPRGQLEAAVRTVAWLCRTHEIDPATIAGHRDHSEQTVCPGRDLQAYVASGLFENWVREVLAGRSPAIHLLPPPEDFPAAGG